MLKIPTNLISREVLVWLGFSAEMANQLWRECLNKYGNRLPVASEFRDAIIEPFRGCSACQDAYTDDDDEWRGKLSAYGLSQVFVSMIMDPRFREQRLREPCAYWAAVTLRQRWSLLVDVFEISKIRTGRVWQHHDWEVLPLSPSMSKLDLFKARQKQNEVRSPCRDMIAELTLMKLKEAQVSNTNPYRPVHQSAFLKGEDPKLFKVVSVARFSDAKKFMSDAPEDWWKTEALLLQNNTANDEDPEHRGARLRHKIAGPWHKGCLLFFTFNRGLALAEYKWAVHRLDSSFGHAGHRSEFEGGADIMMAEIPVSSETSDRFSQVGIGIYHPFELEMYYSLWKEIFVLSRLNWELCLRGGCTTFPGWRWESDENTRQIAEPTLRRIGEGNWIVLHCPAVSSRALWHLSRVMANALTASSPSPTSGPSDSINPNHGATAPEPKYFIYTGEPSFPSDEWVFNTKTEDGQKFLSDISRDLVIYKIILEETA